MSDVEYKHLRNVRQVFGADINGIDRPREKRRTRHRPNPNAEPVPDAPDSMLSVEQVAKLLGVSRWTIYGLLRRKSDIPRVQIGKEWRFRKSSVLRWVEAHEQSL